MSLAAAGRNVGGKVFSVLAGRGASGAVDEHQVVGPRRRHASMRIGGASDRPASARRRPSAAERRIRPRSRRSRCASDRASTPRRAPAPSCIARWPSSVARLVVVARRQAVGEDEAVDAPVVQRSATSRPSPPYISMMFAPPGAMIDGARRCACLPAAGSGEEGRVERAVALGERHLARRPTAGC